MDGIYMGVNCGNDTDTVAAITGALCGAFSGAGAIPPQHLPFLSEVNEMDIRQAVEEVDRVTG